MNDYGCVPIKLYLQNCATGHNNANSYFSPVSSFIVISYLLLINNSLNFSVQKSSIVSVAWLGPWLTDLPCHWHVVISSTTCLIFALDIYLTFHAISYSLQLCKKKPQLNVHMTNSQHFQPQNCTLSES